MVVEDEDIVEKDLVDIIKKNLDIIKKEDIIIFDIDGTLSLNNSGRSHYDMTLVYKDDLNIPVYKMYDCLKDKYKIFICTGRNECSRTMTEEWLKKYNILVPSSMIFFRPDKKNKRDICQKDTIIKEQMYEQIQKEYNILCIFDDRKQVVDHARKLGHTVFQVAENNS